MPVIPAIPACSWRDHASQSCGWTRGGIPGYRRAMLRRTLGPVLVVTLALFACKKKHAKPGVEITTSPSGASVQLGGLEAGAAPGKAGVRVGGLDIGTSAGTCKPGAPCKCSGVGACAKKCDGAGCNFVCEGIGACNFDCPGGKCTVNSSAMGATVLTCEGGDCTLNCSGTGTCTIASCKSGCKTHCSGTGVCACRSGC